MKISIIIPTCKRTHYLKKCLDSLLNQTKKPDEINVIVHKNDKETGTYLNQFIIRHKDNNIRKIIQIHRGVLDAMNLGLKSSSGDIICFIDDDGVADSHWIEYLSNHFTNKNIGGVGGPCIPMVKGKPIIKTSRLENKIIFPGIPIENQIFLTKTLTEADHLRGCNMSFRRDVLEKNKGFDLTLKGDAFHFEMDISFTAKGMGYKIIYDPKILVYHYEAPRDKIVRYSSETIYSNSFNNTYVFLKHYSFIRKIFFIPFDFLIGSFNTPGIMSIIGTSFLGIFIKDRYLPGLNMLIPSLKGKIKAISVLISN